VTHELGHARHVTRRLMPTSSTPGAEAEESS